MASEQPTLNAGRATLAALGAIALCLCGAGCSHQEKFVRPSSLVSPWPESLGPVVIAVAPLRNESGASVADEIAVSDALAAQLQQTDRLEVLSLNRVIAAMRSLGMASIDSPADARRLAQELDADAIVVGSLNAWNPYNPPSIALTLAIFAPHNSRLASALAGARIDPLALQGAPTDYGLVAPGGGSINDPLASAALYLDGANDAVRSAVHTYARGRADPDSALGWERYLASMRLFTEFACHTAAARLLDQERRRQQGDATAEVDTTR